jgi:hypothetical protein
MPDFIARVVIGAIAAALVGGLLGLAIEVTRTLALRRQKW